MTHYEILLNVLDRICAEAPKQNRRYHPPFSDVQKQINARSRALIHLFLKAKFGLLNFNEREEFITDDSQDGGIDGYFIDVANKQVFFIQSKFRNTKENFSNKEILFEDLLKMDTDRISVGKNRDEKGKKYNDKILQMSGKLQEVYDPHWKITVVILANVTSTLTKSHLKKLTGGYDPEIYNFQKIYNELLFPVVQGTYYDPDELLIRLNLSNTVHGNSRIKYSVETDNVKCVIDMMFVPTIEIARVMHKYRNSLLKFNPRSYLGLSTNRVNKHIENSIKDLASNEFALFNNGITILSSSTEYSDKNFQTNVGQVVIKEPQVINGGQTAYTLSKIYDELNDRDRQKVFSQKEVLLKIITFDPESSGDESRSHLIAEISRATNQQSLVDEDDRRSNDPIQLDLQKYLFETAGLFYERKKGEFYDGLNQGYIFPSQIIDRVTFLRMCKCCDMEPANAKRMSKKQLFSKPHFEETLSVKDRFPEYLFAYMCFQELHELRKTFKRNKDNKFGIKNYGYGLSQGQYAMVSACSLLFEGDTSVEAVTLVKEKVTGKWKDFEDFARNQKHNSDYYDEKAFNIQNYYKGSTLAGDISTFFS